MVGGSRCDARNTGVDYGNLEGGNAKAVIDRDELRRLGILSPIDREVQRVVLMSQVEGFARVRRGARLVRENPMTVGIPILIGGLRREHRPWQDETEEREHPTRYAHMLHAAFIA
jgi:hypothetical protein